MKLTLVVFLLCGFVCGLASGEESKTTPARIIFDSDMDSDCDDLLALGILHVLADRGEAEILATMVSTQNPFSGPCMDAINTFYGRPDLPIGSPKGAAANRKSKYAEGIAKEFPHDLASTDKALDAVELYREILSKQPDNSVVIVTVGYLTNIANLLKLPAAGDKPSGLDLVKKKVKLWACMGGNFIGHPAKDDLKLGNVNFTTEQEGSLYAIQHWPVALTFVGREVCSVPSGLKVGARLKELPEKHPVRRGYELYFGGEAKDRHVADPAAVLFALRGAKDYWDVESKGYMDLKPDMTFEWKYDHDAHNYLLKRKVNGKPNDREIEKAIEALVLSKK